MSASRPFVLSIAGFDPSGGAGILADVKTFEQHRVYGLAILTANTIQTETDFVSIKWVPIDAVLQSIATLFEKQEIKAVKIGIVPSLVYLNEIVLAVKRLSPKTKIVWDTVLKSTTEFDFLKIENQVLLREILQKIDLITPNYDEIVALTVKENAQAGAISLSKECSILLKGGHNPENRGVDCLYLENQLFNFPPKETLAFEKHGSGCVLSSAITAQLALGQDLKTACLNAKKYIEAYLLSNKTKLGYHHV
jgi:hydroxymethylpyrimidine/phosphomethylpyrimidine kinase